MTLLATAIAYVAIRGVMVGDIGRTMISRLVEEDRFLTREIIMLVHHIKNITSTHYNSWVGGDGRTVPNLLSLPTTRRKAPGTLPASFPALSTPLELLSKPFCRLYL